MERANWITNKVSNLRRRPYGPNIADPSLPRRAILKNGEYNVIKPKFPGRYIYYIRDVFTSLVDAEWKWTCQVFFIGFVGCWLTFALLWWLILFVHKDLHEDHLPNRQAEIGWTPCVLNIWGFSSSFLYSLETQHTTGYGLRAITEECPEAIFLLCAQLIVGMCIDSFTVGVVLAKLMRPKLVAYTVQFSKNAVICLRDGALCLMFRVGDLKKSSMVGVSIKAVMIHNIKTKEGEKLKGFETSLGVECDESGSDLFLIWPVTVIHKIDQASPLYQLSALRLLGKKLEIIVVLEGTVESTGQGVHAKTSYLNNEILWGRRFEPMVSYNNECQSYEADYSLFDKTVGYDLPLLSAAEMEAQLTEDTNEDEGLTKTNDKPPLDKPLPRYSKFDQQIANDSRGIDYINTKAVFQTEERKATPPFPVWV